MCTCDHVYVRVRGSPERDICSCVQGGAGFWREVCWRVVGVRANRGLGPGPAWRVLEMEVSACRGAAKIHRLMRPKAVLLNPGMCEWYYLGFSIKALTDKP